MSSKSNSIFRIYAFSTAVSLALIAFVTAQQGLKGLFLVLVLAALEVSLSFDNAIVNARILKRMTPGWQQAFLTVGILVAVFGVRILLPILIVSIALGTSFGSVIDLAINNPTEYGHQLEIAHPMIAAFGGIFLLMIFLEYFFEERKTKWQPQFESAMQLLGKFKGIGPILAIVSILLSSRLVHGEEQDTVIVAGLVGLLVYMVIHAVDVALRQVGLENKVAKTGKHAFRAGLIGFIYLEVIDASFSLDGVIGAFAITNQILIIAAGLGIGALYVRTITVHMLRRNVLDNYRYIEHGAHYAIGVLAIIMLASLAVKVPEVVTGTAGLIIIVSSAVHSILVSRSEKSLKHL